MWRLCDDILERLFVNFEPSCCIALRHSVIITQDYLGSLGIPLHSTNEDKKTHLEERKNFLPQKKFHHGDKYIVSPRKRN